MPSYLQLAGEQVWLDQYVPDNLTRLLIEPLRAFYNMGPTAIGAPGDNNHLYGRHRSRNWDLQSRYCTNRTYGTQDARDRASDGNIYRAVDVGIQGQTLFDASHRMDALVRSGGCPGVAEWFGTFDGVNVVGWFEGHPSTSDNSHLWHLHVGLWNQYANDPATLRQVYSAITGVGMILGEDDVKAITEAVWQYYLAPLGINMKDHILKIEGAVGEILTLVQTGSGSTDAAAIIAAVRGEADAVKAEVRDAVADLGEGGAAQVRADDDA